MSKFTDEKFAADFGLTKAFCAASVRKVFVVAVVAVETAVVIGCGILAVSAAFGAAASILPFAVGIGVGVGIITILPAAIVGEEYIPSYYYIPRRKA